MPDIDVDLGDLDTIATSLSDGATALDGLQVPDGPDAGLMSGPISSLLAQVSTSAGELVLAILTAAENVGSAREYYARADAEATATFEEITQAVDAE